ncbi:MAG: glycosyltransferase family 2 protein [Muribaculaceae bacterium]|nr:glycosyltransferase family 2 protein [Muribaculaceae bacterium]
MLLSFVIVEYNSLGEVKKCLSSLDSLKGIEHEVIVSSNSSYDTAKRNLLLKESPANTKWVFNDRNGGFAYAMNRGLEKASGEILVIMNPDIELRYGIGEMYRFLVSHPELGAVAPQVIDRDGNLQDSARPYVTPWRFFKRQMKRIATGQEVVLNPKMDYNKAQTVDWVIGTMIMATREAYNRTGGLSEAYFMYGEDLDWCTRIRKAGLEIAFFPGAQIIYKGTRRARHSWKFTKIFFKSHLHYWTKFGPFSLFLPHRQDINFMTK